jgi:anti-sigma factor RsiW
MKKRVHAYVDGALPERERAEVEAHVARCAPCAAELEQLQQLTALLASAPTRPVSAAFEQRLSAALRDPEAPPCLL